MNIRDAILLVFFANLLSSAVMVLNGRAAAKYHIGFPALARAAFGTFGSYFYIVIRSILGIIWGGVYVQAILYLFQLIDRSSSRQLYFTGQFVSVMLRCIFSGWDNIPNGIPESQGITTQEMVGFFLALLITMPFVLIHTSKIPPREQSPVPPPVRSLTAFLDRSFCSEKHNHADRRPWPCHLGNQEQWRSIVWCRRDRWSTAIDHCLCIRGNEPIQFQLGAFDTPFRLITDTHPL